MKIGILGSRGIPNNYGGFEQLAQYLAEALVERGHEVYVYNSHNHPYQEKTWKNVHIIHTYDPEYKYGTFGQFIYDLNSIRDSKKRDFDVLLQLGYTSSSIWSSFLPKQSIILTNMDGMEWKRSKYNKWVQRFLKIAEKWAVKSSDYLIADSLGIQKYLKEKYAIDSRFIAYGADIFDHPQEEILTPYLVQPYHYHMLIARLEPENNIEAILQGIVDSQTPFPFLIIGNHQSKYGEYLKQKFNAEHIRFIGAIYDINVLNNLRYYCRLYFHGHSVGGTNPSLLEAMSSGALICAHQNIFNATILGEDAYYFENSTQISQLVQSDLRDEERQKRIKANYEKIKNQYQWPQIAAEYEQYMQACYDAKK